jgi:hypothetical protein
MVNYLPVSAVTELLIVYSTGGLPVVKLNLCLHLQASCMHAILLDKVRAWAIQSCGYFPVLEIDGHGSTTAHVAKYDGSSMFKWAKVGQRNSSLPLRNHKAPVAVNQQSYCISI